jgi:hypothetical protein
MRLLELQSIATPERTRIDVDSVLLGGGVHEYDVLHVGSGAVILRPGNDNDDDLIITNERVGLMPGGVQLPEADFERWRGVPVNSRQRFSASADSFLTAAKVDLHLGTRPSRWQAVAAALDALRPGPIVSHVDVGPHDGRRLARAAVAGNAEAVRQLALEYVGVGMGSTPAGDDLIVGACAAIRCAGHVDAARTLAAAASAIERRTTRASRIYLRAATAGRFSERVHRLARSVQSETEAVLAMQSVRRWGGSSGADLASGFLGAQAYLLGLSASTARRGAA